MWKKGWENVRHFLIFNFTIFIWSIKTLNGIEKIVFGAHWNALNKWTAISILYTDFNKPNSNKKQMQFALYREMHLPLTIFTFSSNSPLFLSLVHARASPLFYCLFLFLSFVHRTDRLCLSPFQSFQTNSISQDWISRLFIILTDVQHFTW